ncbi:MAG: hypothetical protein RLZ75_1492 [Pseudomonadota bacterium]|jgi:hypothetical protein
MNFSLRQLVADLHDQARKLEALGNKEALAIASNIRKNADLLNDIEKTLSHYFYLHQDKLDFNETDVFKKPQTLFK